MEELKNTIYPNGATDDINITCIQNTTFLDVELINMTGVKVFSKVAENHSLLSVQNYPRGMYLLRISENNKVIYTEKILFK